jgi:DNA-directed RNA polymerase subunit RPC12/RpoP
MSTQTRCMACGAAMAGLPSYLSRTRVRCAACSERVALERQARAAPVTAGMVNPMASARSSAAAKRRWEKARGGA